MKTVITSTGNQLSSTFDLRFGRAKYFCLYDENTKETKFYQNPNTAANSGAGVKTAEKMVELEAQKVISGDFGPKAKDLLEKFNIQMVILPDDKRSVKEIIDSIQ
ncbi:MAG TPA: dinitrogenase iron-molybdenum cofactor biosynthesis protein [Bacteroidetes bacterium]|nr:dinitrogenase iron-molybdenum cofactor biosynthesis protein [Bacteroidota bacterium]